jgi:hypothetical protein
MTLAGGVPLNRAQIAWPNFNPGYYPINSSVNPWAADRHTSSIRTRDGRRQYQWSFGLQREIVPNLLVEASYVGNRAIWLTFASLVNYNYLSKRLAGFGLSLNNAADLTILNAQIGSAPAVGSEQAALPDVPVDNSCAITAAVSTVQLRLSGAVKPLGNTWYDSLQIKQRNACPMVGFHVRVHMGEGIGHDQ